MKRAKTKTSGQRELKILRKAQCDCRERLIELKGYLAINQQLRKHCSRVQQAERDCREGLTELKSQLASNQQLILALTRAQRRNSQIYGEALDAIDAIDAITRSTKAR